VAAEMVSGELAGDSLLLRSRPCSSDFVIVDDLGFRMSDAELDNPYFHFLARRCSTDKD
jgi:hypothetical protein